MLVMHKSANCGAQVGIDSLDWNHIVRSDGPRLFRYFCARFEPEQARDLVQEVLLRILRKDRKSGGYDPSQGPFIAYALGVAHFVAREAYRVTARNREDLAAAAVTDQTQSSADAPDDESPCAEDLLAAAQTAEALRAAIRRLTPSEQDIVSLLVDQELSLSEVAAITGFPLNTVKSHIHRAKGKLKALLAPDAPIRVINHETK